MPKRSSLSKVKVFIPVFLIICVAGFFFLKRLSNPRTINMIQTTDSVTDSKSMSGLNIMVGMKAALAEANYPEGKYGVSFTHAPNNKEGANFLAQQAFQNSPAIVVALGDLAVEAAIAENKNQENWILFYSSKDHSGPGVVGILDCGNVDSERLGHEMGKILVQIFESKLSHFPARCIQ